jgi:hypothetical protein
VPAAVNLSLPHTISILLTRTKVYGYNKFTVISFLKKPKCLFLQKPNWMLVTVLHKLICINIYIYEYIYINFLKLLR